MKTQAAKIIMAKEFIAVIFLLGILAGVFFVAFRFNQGSDLASSTLLQIQLDHEEDVSKVTAETSKIFQPSRVEKEGTSLYRIYFQNISSDKLQETKDKLANNIGVVVKQDSYILVPDQALLLQQSANLRILPVLILFAFIYKLAVLRKLNFSRMEILHFLFSELISLLWTISLLVGAASILGKLGVQFNRAQLLTMLLGICLYLFIGVFVLLRLKEFRKRDSEEIISRSIRKYVLADWPAPVFVATVIVVVVVLPYLGFGTELISTGILLLLSVLAGLYTQLLFMPVLLGLLTKLINRIRPLRNLKLLSRKW